MKTYFLLILVLLGSSQIQAQSVGDVLSIALSGDANTEQSAKLELIRILNERMTKLTVGQLNSRILVSTGVKNYYKVDELLTMHKNMWGLRSKYTTLASNLEKGNPGFNATTGNGFSWKYMQQYNNAMSKAEELKNQLLMVLKDGKPIALPPMPTFNITMASSSANNTAQGFMHEMDAIVAKYGVHSQDEIDKLPADKREAYNGEVEALKAKYDEIMKSYISSNGGGVSLTTFGNVVGAFFGVPGAGSLIAGLFGGGGGAAASALVGAIVDKFEMPDTYFDSETLKLTDAERLRIIDELHLRMSELFQQTIAMGTNMSTEAKVRYNEISQPRNDIILYGPKK